MSGSKNKQCSKVDAHIQSDSIEYGNVDGRTFFWLEHHHSLVEFEAKALKRRWEAAPDLLKALKALLVCLDQCTGIEDYADTIWLEDVKKAKAAISKAESA